jgi:N-acetyl-anhydromuramyl-L-alanine amidase AmpD
MTNIVKFGKFKTDEKNKNKRQIILCNTYRSKSYFLSSLKHRFNGESNKIPNYLITRDGEIVSILPDDYCSNFFLDNDVNKNSIIICLENLGWLKKIPLENEYYNCIGEKCSDYIFEKKWRDKIFWQNYTKVQYDSLSEICKKLLKKFSINKTFIGHNTKVDGIKIFNGIVCRSNYNNRFTDISPSFKFDDFKKSIEDE